MNAKQKEVLHQHRNFLTKNISWNDDLGNRLVASGVITDTILKDIQNGATGKQQKLSKLLEVLPLRGSSMYEKFCDVLQLQGHPFIADFLRDEELIEEKKLDVSSVYKRVPFLDKVLKDEVRKQLEEYIQEKVKENSLKGLWSKEAVAREKDKAIEAKRRQLEDSFEFEVRDKKRQEEIAVLEKQLQDYQTEIIELKSQINFLKSEYQDSENQLKSEFGVQMKFSMANENALRRIEDKYRKSEKVLSQIEGTLQDILKPPPRNSERDQMAFAEFPFAFVAKDFENLIEKYNLLLAIEKQYENMLDERNYILSHLGHHTTDTDRPSLLNAYREFAVKTDEDLTDLRQRVEKHSGVIEGQQEKIQHLNEEVEKQSHASKLKGAGRVWQNAMLGVMRKQLNDVKHDNRIKDTKIKHLEGEINKLKTRLAENEAAMKVTEASTPRSHFLDPAQQNGITHNTSSTTTDEDDETSSKKRRNTLLPPLGNRILFQTAEINFSPQNVTPQKSKGRPLGSVNRNAHDFKKYAGPEAAMSQQLRLENKAKLAHAMSSSVGNLKSMHGKTGHAHVR